MARTALAVTKVPHTGTLDQAAALSAANVDGHSIVHDAREWLVVVNGAGAPITVTLTTPGLADTDLAVADRTFAVGAGKTAMIPISPAVYRRSDDAVWVDFSAVTTVTIGAFQLPE